MPQQTVFADIPVVTTICVGCIVIWLYIFSKGVKAEKFAFNYVRIVSFEEWWRTVTGTVSHIHILHIAFNMSSLWNTQGLEKHFGSYFYLKITFILFLLISLTMLISFYIGTKYYQRDYTHSYHLGYSGVLFGLMAFECWITGGSMAIFGISIPYFLAPIVSMIIIQVLVPNASFIGHLSGIISGFLLALPVTKDFFLFDLGTNITFSVLFPMVLLAILYSIKPIKEKCLNIFARVTGRAVSTDASGTGSARKQRIVNGNLVYETV